MASELGIHASGVEHPLWVHPVLQATVQTEHSGLERMERKIDVTRGIAGGMSTYGFSRATDRVYGSVTAQPTLRAPPVNELVTWQVHRGCPQRNGDTPKRPRVEMRIEKRKALLAQIGPPLSRNFISPNALPRSLH